MLLSEGCSLVGSCKLTDFFTFLRHKLDAEFFNGIPGGRQVSQENKWLEIEDNGCKYNKINKIREDVNSVK